MANGDTDLVVANVDSIEELASQLRVAGNRFEKQIDDIYRIIKELHNDWQGLSYDEFSARCEEARPALDTLTIFVKAYSKLLDSSIKEAGETFIESAASALGGDN